MDKLKKMSEEIKRKNLENESNEKIMKEEFEKNF